MSIVDNTRKEELSLYTKMKTKIDDNSLKITKIE